MFLAQHPLKLFTYYIGGFDCPIARPESSDKLLGHKVCAIYLSYEENYRGYFLYFRDIAMSWWTGDDGQVFE